MQAFFLKSFFQFLKMPLNTGLLAKKFFLKLFCVNYISIVL